MDPILLWTKIHQFYPKTIIPKQLSQWKHYSKRSWTLKVAILSNPLEKHRFDMHVFFKNSKLQVGDLSFSIRLSLGLSFPFNWDSFLLLFVLLPSFYLLKGFDWSMNYNSWLQVIPKVIKLILKALNMASIILVPTFRALVCPPIVKIWQSRNIQKFLYVQIFALKWWILEIEEPY